MKFEDMINKVIEGNCLEVMRNIPDNSIDCIVTDPPYGMDYQSSWRIDKFDKIIQDNDISWFYPFINEAHRVLKENTHIYVFCNDYAISEFRNGMKEAGFNIKRTLIWVKNNHTSGDLEGDYGNKTEFILYAQKGRKNLNGKRDTNVLYYDRVNSLRHPTEKPLSLFNYLIQKSTSEGDIVLDPFLGSGTTSESARNLGRNYIGIELNPQYVKVANDRLAQDILI